MVSTEEKIKILLQEYTTLRQEIVARTTNGFQLLSVGAIVFTWILTSSQTRTAVFWGLLLAAVAVFCQAVWFTVREIKKLAARIRELEADINRRAGEDLLVWESKWGGEVTGHWGRARPSKESPKNSDGAA